jgi:D-glycero-alpha-D-manno-heptose-7-phosphate kinase
MIIRAKAPLRVSFAGGGTDVAPFYLDEGGAVLSSTINRYVYGSLRPRHDGTITIESVDLGLSLSFRAEDTLSLDGELDLVKAAIIRLGGTERHGFDLVIRSGAPPGSGLGSSSALIVTLVALLQEHYQLPLTEYDAAHLAYEIERVDLAIQGGLQDHYASTFGGFNFIEFGERVVVNPLRVRPAVVNELEMSLILCFTGITRESAGIIADQTTRVTGREIETLEGMRAQKKLAQAMKTLLLRGELHEFGSMLDEAWKEKKRMSPMISNARIDEAYELAVSHGALGGKVTGAGGGGHILFFCDFEKKHRVADALTRFGANVSEFSFEREGVMTWRV